MASVDTSINMMRPRRYFQSFRTQINSGFPDKLFKRNLRIFKGFRNSRFSTRDMEDISATFQLMVDSFTEVGDLMNFAATWGIQDSTAVRFRLFQLRNLEYGDEFVSEELERFLQHVDGPTAMDALEMALDYVREQEEVEECLKAIMFDDKMDQIARDCMDDGEWESMPPLLQVGGGEEPRPGLSHSPDPQRAVPHDLRYNIKKKSQRKYANNGAVDVTYQVKIDENHQGQRLQDVTEGLHQMFNDVLGQARGNLAGNDLGRVVLHHDALHDAIVVPLRPWDRLNAEAVMGTIEKVLNSNKGLAVDESFSISVGSIELPKGGARRRITKIKGHKNSLQLKTSIVTITNGDQMCLARAIGVSWAKLKTCTRDEWKELTKHRQGQTNVQLILEHQKFPESYFKTLRNKTRDEQRQLAFAISQLAGVPLSRPASLDDVAAFEEALGVRVMVISASLGNKFITSPSVDERPCIYVYLVDDDHFHAVTSITGFFSAVYFCEKCLAHFDHREKHRCDNYCITCKRDQCPKTETPIRCQDCNMDCRSTHCFQAHKIVIVHRSGPRKGKPSGLSQCNRYWKCPTCYKVLRTEKRNKEDHRCGEYLCSSCQQYVLDDHLCFLRATPAKQQHNPKFIFFDFECSQDQTLACDEGYKPVPKPHCTDCQSQQVCNSCSKCRNCNASWCGKATHRPNFVVAHSVCPKCIDKEISPNSVCKGCGTRCDECDLSEQPEVKDAGPCPGKCGFREVTFEGADTAENFGQWLFSDQHKYFKAIAHNMKGYDGYFLLEYLIDHSMRPDKIIYNGSKIMYMTLERDLHVKVIDSLNFLPMKLSTLPKAFGLRQLKKGWFPHYFNTRENRNYVGPYPEAKFYGHDFMGEGERTELLAWLSERKDDAFDLRKEILAYCRSDVDILRQACLKFRHLLMSATGECREVVNEKGKLEEKWSGAVDPFDSVTIASVCMNVFRTKFLEEEWRVKLEGCDEWVLAKLLAGKLYVSRGINWIPCTDLKKEERVNDREFVRSPIAKVPPGGYKDQYSKSSIEWLEWRARLDNVTIQHALNVGEKSLTGTRYKLDGYCAETNTSYEFHGCLFHGCPVCFSTNRDVTRHPLTKQSMDELYALTMKKKAYLQRLGMKYICIWEHDFQKQKNQNAEMKEFINDLDLIDRLDPRESFFGGRTNASQLYYRTKEHERVKYVDFTSLYPWVNKYCRYPVGHPVIITKEFGDIKDYFGIAKVKILPPRGLYHPILPYRSNGKLKFPLCMTCADTENQSTCTCSDEEREMTGTWCTPEIETAVRLGYQIKKIYEVYHWEDSTQYDPLTGEGGLFAKYINTFLKLKQEASGPPDWIKSENDTSAYLEQYFQKEGVSLDRESIRKNPGLRALAKLCLNSFWGKFGQRLNMRQTQIFHESEVNEFFQAFSDPMKEPINFHILSNNMVQVEWTYKNECLPEDNKTNIYLATFTTCWARLKLYSVLEKLDRRVLYYDTDSVIYVSRPGQCDPPLGDYLGELTDELEGGEHIVEFVSGGPKNYAYKTNRNKETCKVRGFTLNHTNSQLINFESVKTVVTDPQSCPTITLTNPSKICRDKRKRKLVNREEKKSYQMVYTKRRRAEHFDTEPYGF